MPESWHTARAVALGIHGMVASEHPLATLTGVDILRHGGNAADAAVAVNAMLAVTTPYACGLGGDFFCLYYEASSGQISFLNGAGRSGSHATLENLSRLGHQAVPQRGALSVSVPGCVAAWQMLLERFGSRMLSQLIGAANGWAEEGVPCGPLLSQTIEEWRDVIDDPEWRRIWTVGGQAPQLGELIRQPDLAETLRMIAADGAEGFYQGFLGKKIGQHLEALGSFVRADDFANHSGEWGEPITTSYRGYLVHETPPPTQGAAVLLALNLLEAFELGRLPFHSTEHLHLLAEIAKLAYADRDRWLADPSQESVPLKRLLDKVYAEARRTLFDPKQAQAFGRWGNPNGDTTGFVIADPMGNVISVIQSLYGAFGSGVTVPGTGVTLHNRGSYFNSDPGHPNHLAPRKRPFHTLIAAIVTKDDQPVMGFATMGADGQAQFHLQVLTNVLDYEMNIQEAIERPRFLLGRSALSEPNDTLRLEGRIDRRVAQQLAEMGHNVEIMDDWYHRAGHAHGVVKRGATWMGGADPRTEGLALGF
ncbi:MAG TPA: gamma-glutamyltransferase [Methylomirabilota bacterium]|nr:gamma-glutamyltransferase [Methylomirabilota bacterium]